MRTVRDMSWRSLIVVVLAVAVVGGGLCVWFFGRLGCGEDVQVTPINGSQWVVMTKFYSCSAVDGAVTVTALNTRTKKEEEIAFIDEANGPDVEVISPTKVRLTFDNLIDIVRSKRAFGNVTVSYRFRPSDNPEARRRYQYWMHHPNDPQAERWAEEHFRTNQSIQ
jgi:hypothetical protein